MDQLLRMDEKLYETFNRRAATYYLHKLVDYEQKLTEYGQASVYEEAGWQAAKREWLYHTGLISGEAGKSDAMVQITQVFLDAWWWWGCYVHFDFCDQIIADLGVLAMRRQHHVHAISAWPELASMHRFITSLVENYPVGQETASNREWQNAHQALLDILSLCGLQEGGRAQQEDQLANMPDSDRQVCALINVFLAETLRHQNHAADKVDACHKRVEEYYSRAEKQFVEGWSQAWVAYHRADFSYEQHRIQRTEEHWRRSAEKRDLKDDELTANLHRLQGDMDWDHRMYEDAARSYGRAVLHAYLFHFVNGNPDEYTMQFYIDVRTHVIERLYELWNENDAGQQGVLTCATVMSREMGHMHKTPGDKHVHELLRDKRPVELAHTLFPRGPLVSELEKFDSDFGRRHRCLIAELDMDQVRTDLAC